MFRRAFIAAGIACDIVGIAIMRDYRRITAFLLDEVSGSCEREKPYFMASSIHFDEEKIIERKYFDLLIVESSIIKQFQLHTFSTFLYSGISVCQFERSSRIWNEFGRNFDAQFPNIRIGYENS